MVIVELFDRGREHTISIPKAVLTVVTPAIYLFVGLVLVFAYNDIIAAAKDTARYDWLFMRADSFLLHGHSVTELARKTSSTIPSWTYSVAESLYFGMFDQMGAALLLISICLGIRQGLRFVGAQLTAYYLALAIFFLWPSMGPFYMCSDHFAHFPKWLATYGIQQHEVWKAKLVSGPARASARVDTDYFIAFPCLHIAHPLIVLWFTRQWKRITYVLVAYDMLLVPAILLLEWHYVVDLIGGAAVAALAIWLNHRAEDVDSSAHDESDVLERQSTPAAIAVG